jgi:hypothetical protein
LPAGVPDFWSRLERDIDLGKDDYARFYSLPNLALVGLGVAVAAPLANTDADQSIRLWYQNHVRHRGMDPVANAVNYAGDFWVLVPVGLEAAALGGCAGEDWATDGGICEWSNRCLRAAAVGYPTVIALFVALGGHRPDKDDSSWHPFQDVHGVSGHAFIGAIPFLTAASMTDDPLLQVPLVLGSTLTGWSRIHLDRHYFSQVCLGWWLAYLSVRSVNGTQADRAASLSLSPTVGPDGAGVLLHLKY